MASSPISSWQIEGENVEAVTDFLFLDFKITVDGNHSHKIRRQLLFCRKVMTNLDSVFKKQRHHFAHKDLYKAAKVFPVVMYKCGSWKTKKAEWQRTDAFEMWSWRKLLRVPWTARRSISQS